MSTYLDCWGEFVLLALRALSPGDPAHVLVPFLHRDVPQSLQVVLKDHLRGEDVLTEPHHATATHRGQGRIAQVLHFKHDAHLQSTAESMSAVTAQLRKSVRLHSVTGKWFPCNRVYQALHCNINSLSDVTV